ncbi:phosphoribosyltransferase-like protein [Ustulina deusta]|nr:phosphoribosyltransferase-like protein [Ustulina deusta]
MSAPVPSDGNQVETSATNPHQPGLSSSTVLDASRRQPASSAPGAAELASEPISTLSPEDQKNLAVAKKLVIDNLRYEPDFPIPGIKFIDILPIFQNPVAFGSLLDVLVLLIRERFGSQIPDIIVGLEARGFLFGPPLALRLNRPFVPVRKKGKMPGACRTVEYTKEYGKDEFQVQTSAIKPGQQCLIVDDIIATGKPTHHLILKKAVFYLLVFCCFRASSYHIANFVCFMSLPAHVSRNLATLIIPPRALRAFTRRYLWQHRYILAPKAWCQLAKHQPIFISYT